MKKQAVRNSVLAVALGAVIVLPGIVHAGSFDEYNANFQKDFSKVDSLIRPGSPTAAGVAGATTADSLREATEAKMAEVGAKLQLNGKRAELNQEEQKLQTWNEKIKKVNAIGPAMDGIIKKAISDRVANLDELDALASSINPSTPFVNPSNFDVSGLAKACQKGVDFSPLMQMVKNFGKDKMEFLKDKVSKIVAAKKDDAAALEKQKVLDLMTNLQALNAKNEDLDAQILKPEQFAKLDSVQKIEKRLELLKKQKNPQAKAQFKQSEGDLLGQFQKFLDQSFQVKGNDQKLQVLGANFASDIEGQQQQMMMIAQQSTRNLIENCERESAGIFQEIDKARVWMSPMVGDQLAQTDATAQEQRANSQGFHRGDTSQACPNITQNLTGLIGGFFGGDLNTQLQAIKSSKDPNEMLEQAVKVMDSISQMQAQIGPMLQPLMDGCDQAGRVREQLKQRTQTAQQAGGGQQGATASRGARRGAGAVASAPNHTGNPQTR